MQFPYRPLTEQTELVTVWNGDKDSPSRGLLCVQDDVGCIRVSAGRRSRSIGLSEADAPHAQKYCAKCRRLHPLTDFGRHRTQLDHRQPWCRAAMLAYRQQRRARIAAVTPVPVTDKTCTRCHTMKHIQHFCLNRGEPDGRSAWCRACAKAHKDQHRGRLNGLSDRACREMWGKETR